MFNNRDMDYFPPNGSRYKWNHKALGNGPWWFRYHFNEGDPRSCLLDVNFTDKGYQGMVVFYPMSSDKIVKYTKFYKNPLNALKATENLGDLLIKNENLPSWTEEALQLGWRHPIRKV